MSNELVQILAAMSPDSALPTTPPDGNLHTAASLANSLRGRTADDLYADLLRLWTGGLVTKVRDHVSTTDAEFDITPRGRQYVQQVSSMPAESYPVQLVVQVYATGNGDVDAQAIAAGMVWRTLGVLLSGTPSDGTTERYVAIVDVQAVPTPDDRDEIVRGPDGKRKPTIPLA